ncbi:MAG: TetR/AcrR family transcriptional regulator, partial [Sphingomonadales bacterium]
MAEAIADRTATGLSPEMLELFDPFLPIAPGAGKPGTLVGGARRSQRVRRSEILATIRRLLTEVGCHELTVRGIADGSGYAIQTVYNLVGPRNQAIAEAINEYSIFVGRMATPALENPLALPAITNMWVDVQAIRPEFTRQCNLIFFSPARVIYYRFRDRQLRGMNKLLRQQQKSGILKDNVDAGALAEHLVFFSTSMWLEWADRPFPLETLREKLNHGFLSLLGDKLTPEYRDMVLSK